jgi:WD40 repeat protein
MDQQEFKYRAFISYSHRDKVWGDWLHKTLETYRTPARLVGRASRDGTVPKRLYPVFRDRDELPSSASLGDNIDAALRESCYLVVICSPTAAVSRWVDGEIRAFKKLGREDRVLCLIVDGEPNATDRPDSGELECFPPALRFRVDAKGELTKARTEPIAADARPGKDGKTNARLKILAGLLGVGYDELRQREKQRRFWRRVQTAVASLALLAVLAGGWYWEAQQKTRQSLVLQYTEQGRQLFVGGKPLQAAVYLSEAYRLDGRAPVLRFLLARSMHYVEALQASVSVQGVYLAGDVAKDGRRFVTSTGSDSAQVWDANDGHLLLTLKGRYPTLIWASFSPDGKYFAGASKPEMIAKDLSVEIWDASSGKLLHSLPFPDGFLIRAVFDGSGKRLLTRDERNNLVQVWDVASGKELFRLPQMTSHFEHAGFSPDGRYIVTVQNDNSVHVWDGSDGHAQHVLRGHEAEVTNFSFSQDGRLLVTVSKDKSAQVWELGSGKRIAKIARKNADDYQGGHSDEVNDAEFTPDDKRLITASNDKTARVWDVATGKLLSDLGRMGQEATGISVSRDGKYATVYGKDDLIWVWDLGDYSQRAVLYATGAVFLPDGRHLLTFDSPSATVQRWDLDKLAANRSVAGEHPVFSADQSHLATLQDDKVRIWDAAGKLVATLVPERNPKTGDTTYPGEIQFSPDGARLLMETADSDGSAGLWDVVSGKRLLLLHGKNRYLQAAAFSPDGSRVYTCGADRNAPPHQDEEDNAPTARIAELWDSRSGAELASFVMPDGCVDYPHFDAAGTRMAGTVREYPNRQEVYYHVELWDLAAGKRIVHLPGHVQGYYGDVAFAPGGELLTGTEDGKVNRWDPATGASRGNWDTHGSPLESLLYSPDGASLLTAHEDGTLEVWGNGGAAMRWQTKGEQFGVNKVSWSRDGAFLLLLGSSKPSRILDANDSALLAELPGDPHLTDTADFSPRGDLVVTGSYDAPSIRLWDMHLETREPAAVSTEVRCKVRWQLQAGQLVPANADLKACTATR